MTQDMFAPTPGIWNRTPGAFASTAEKNSEAEDTTESEDTTVEED